MDLYRDRAREAFSAEEVELVGARSCPPSPGDCARWRWPRRRAASPGRRTARAPRVLRQRDAAPRWTSRRSGCSPSGSGRLDWRRACRADGPDLRRGLARAARVAEGRDRGPASARLRSASGRWLLVHARAWWCRRQRNRADRVEDRAGQVSAGRADRSRGLSLTRARAGDHRGVCPRPVQRRRSAPSCSCPRTPCATTSRPMFAKVGVSSRGELVWPSRLAEHYRPALHEPDAAVERVRWLGGRNARPVPLPPSQIVARGHTGRRRSREIRRGRWPGPLGTPRIGRSVGGRGGPVVQLRPEHSGPPADRGRILHPQRRVAEGGTGARESPRVAPGIALGEDAGRGELAQHGTQRPEVHAVPEEAGRGD